MPPKASSGRPRPLPPSLSSSLSASIAADAPLPREPFSIASFFDAASAHRSSGGGGYRVDSFSDAPPTPLSGFPRASHSPPASGHRTAATRQVQHLEQPQRQQQHWSSSTPGQLSSSPQSGDGEHYEQQQQHSTTTRDVSSTLQEVRRRIISDLDASREGSRESSGKLHAHRQRALRVAFGEDGASRRRGSRASCVMTSEGGASPTDARRSKSQHTPNAENDEDDELMVASVEFSLLCPYSRLPMRYPVRSNECNHLQCCDLDSWIVMLNKCRSMRDPVGPCPVCERRVTSSSLQVDLWMKHVIDQMPAGTHMVALEPDGAFRSGDTTRERRKEQMIMEVVDATQDDYENYFGDVVDGDDDVVVQRHPVTTSDASTGTSAALFPVGSRRPRMESPAAPEARSGVPSAGGDHRAGSPPLAQVKTEKAAILAAEAEAAAGTSPSVPTSQEDGGVVVVHFVEGRHDGLQALPSQIRLWALHCTRCGAPRVKAEDGLVQGCQRCGHDAKGDWNFVRRFEASSSVSMELVPDGTLVLQGVDILAPYLYRAGFYRSLFEVMEYASVAERQQQQYRPPADVWTSSFPLNRFEIDFLEACCARIAQGETLDSIESMIVPSLFRIPRRRRPGGSGQTSFTQMGHGSGRHGGLGLATASQAH
ncbi:Zinc-finger of the MIZ type in Nse subunit/MIZ/SP-RING zinc finger containing protein [Leishmania donovani]|nr:Zinc-finger of the MIZ type in Nse subunit/MIZ/SP-RING zinc finger containing protein [Leishmania donovani]